MRLRPRTLRGRLTVIFALVTLALSLLVGVLVDVQYRSALNSAVDEGLQTRFLAAAQQVKSSKGSDVRPPIPDAESFAEVIGTDGTVRAAAPRSLRRAPVISGSDLTRARRHRVTLVHDAGPRGERARLLAGPVGNTGEVVVVGTSLEEATRAQHRLELALAIGLPLLASLVTLAGWFLAGAALSPVQEMIEDADVISARSAGQLSRRLAVREDAGQELAELARRLNHLLERIEFALEHERMFLDDASHELRTPISIARENWSWPDSRPTTAPRTPPRWIRRSKRSTASTTLRAASSCSRTRAAGPPPLTQFALADAARLAVESAVAVSRNSHPGGVRTTVDGDAVVRGDAVAIERAVRNLVENALRYARAEVVVTIRTDGVDAVVDVHDDGPGFPQEWLEQGVGRFAAGDSPETHGGAGLGLAIVDAIAVSHGGSVAVGPGPGGVGASVQLRLPREGVDLAAAR